MSGMSNETLKSLLGIPEIKKRKRTGIDIATKLEIIKLSATKRTSELAAQFGFSPSTISTIISPAKKIKYMKLLEEDNIDLRSKSLKSPTYSMIDEACLLWYTSLKKHINITITGSELKAKALQFAEALKITDFKASNGWLENFKQRNK